MVVLLLWLTVSIPYLYNAQQENTSVLENKKTNNQQKDPTNPFADASEERTSVTVAEEYLQHESKCEYSWVSISNFYIDFCTPVYLAFHCDLISPPPEV